MLIEKNKPNVVKGILFTGLLTLLASCGNSSALEGMIKADPKLMESSVTSTSRDSSNSDNEITTTSTADNSQTDIDVVEKEGEIASNNSLDIEDNSINPAIRQGIAKTDLPANFPPSFPIYPKVSLKEAKVGDDEKSGMLTWTSSDNSKAIADYYQAELTANDWEIIKPFAFDSKAEIARAIAVKDNHKIHLTLLRSRNKETGDDGTKLSAIYEPSKQNIASSNSETTTQTKPKSKAQQSNLSSTPPQNKSQDIEEVELFPDAVQEKQNNLATKTLEDDDYIPSSSSDFADLDNVPEPLKQPLETVAALGILTPYTQKGNIEVSKFAPNAVITRGEYSRWLIAANNLYYEGDSGKKIYVVNNPSQPAFQDVKSDDPDFGAIQGLAEAGLVPSRLTQDSTKLLFRPNAPLTREDLVTWKVPLDTRQALPKASIEAIEKSWGFQDAAGIDSSAIRALYADYQNGDRSNVRRIFGFTTLFQAKKPVTRAEAAASLWYFGFQGDGIAAQEILELEVEKESNS